MKRILIEDCNEYVVTVSEAEYLQLQNGDVSANEILEMYQETDRCFWKNGSTEWE